MERKTRIKAYICKNPDEVRKGIKPYEVEVDFTGLDEKDCYGQALQYVETFEYELTGYDVYL